jgi:Ser/Thr protein kinase RdoA (MazF antagonist)
LQHQHNTTFKVEADGGPYVLRISRPGAHTPAAIESEMKWLLAVGADTDLRVPGPVLTSAGSAVATVTAPGVPGERSCVLLRWIDGRFFNQRLTLDHMRQWTALESGLQDHAAAWTLPAGFIRPRLDALTAGCRRTALFGSPGSALVGDHPAYDDSENALTLIASLMSSADGDICAEALEVVRATTRDLKTHAGAFGLIHGDLHRENVLFHEGRAGAIDFDDCGWGFHLYDLAVMLWDLEEHPRFGQLRDALLAEYSGSRPLTPGHEAHLDALIILRRLQILMWVLESRQHPAFRDEWKHWARLDIDTVAAALGGGGSLSR